jgi:myosin-5
MGFVYMCWCRRYALGHSIILNGESGAGKTETARALLRHLTSAPDASVSTEEVPQVSPAQFAQSLKDRIAHANVLLEALGNARLSRNVNSRSVTLLALA